LFLTDRRQPYADNERAFGGQNKTAWRAMRRRTINALRQLGAREAWQLRRHHRAKAIDTIASTKEQCALVSQITPHWFRHHLATFMLSNGGDIRAVMEQGGWRSMEVVLGYAHDVPERRRALIERMAVDTPSTRSGVRTTKKSIFSRI